MKILKYGEGYPKTMTCKFCNSELEYEVEDVSCYYKQNYVNDNNVVFVEEHKVIDCPVCRHSVELETLLVQYPMLVVPEVKTKSKKRWWQK